MKIDCHFSYCSWPLSLFYALYVSLCPSSLETCFKQMKSIQDKSLGEKTVQLQLPRASASQMVTWKLFPVVLALNLNKRINQLCAKRVIKRCHNKCKVVQRRWPRDQRFEHKVPSGYKNSKMSCCLEMMVPGSVWIGGSHKKKKPDQKSTSQLAVWISSFILGYPPQGPSAWWGVWANQ
jgi:hypothetical protein